MARLFVVVGGGEGSLQGVAIGQRAFFMGGWGVFAGGFIESMRRRPGRKVPMTVMM